MSHGFTFDFNHRWGAGSCRVTVMVDLMEKSGRTGLHFSKNGVLPFSVMQCMFSP